MQYFTQAHCSLFFHGYGLHYNTRSKEKFYTVQEEDMQYFTKVHYSHYFTWIWAAL